jgi:hypothetical protein
MKRRTEIRKNKKKQVEVDKNRKEGMQTQTDIQTDKKNFEKLIE